MEDVGDLFVRVQIELPERQSWTELYKRRATSQSLHLDLDLPMRLLRI